MPQKSISRKDFFSFDRLPPRTTRNHPFRIGQMTPGMKGERNMKQKDRKLVLEDGSVYTGYCTPTESGALPPPIPLS